MKILIISAAAPPEPICAGRVHWDIADHMANDSNEVWLISPHPSRPLTVKYERCKNNRVTKVKDNFYHVNVNSFTYPKYNLFYRIYESFSFGLKSIRYVNRAIKEYDLMYVSSWPFIGQLMIIMLRKNKKAPLIMNVQDLYPESFFTKINSKFLNTILKPFYRIDRYIADRSTHLTVVSEPLRQVYLKNRKTSKDKLTVLLNWQDESEFVKPVLPKEQIFDKYNLKTLDGKFIFMYLGNIGPVAGVETIISAFAGSKIDNAALLIAGSGTYKEKCRLLAEKLKITNICFMEVPPGLKPVVELQSISDVLLLPILPNAAISSVPSKLIAYMFSGKPVITSADAESETAEAIRKSGCGWITEYNNNSAWIKLMKQVYETDKANLKSMGKSGFEHAMKYYSKSEGLKKISQLFYKFKIT